MTAKYATAIVSGRIIQYLPDSVEHVQSEWDPSVTLVRYKDGWGCNCSTPADNFMPGTYEELQAIINEQHSIHEEKVKATCAKYPQATDTEKLIINYMIGDGYEPDDLDYDEIQRVTQGVISYCEFNASLLDAYMDYMH